MFYVRHPKEKGQELIGQALATLWMVVHSVQGIMFKDLKQILRKEQVGIKLDTFYFGIFSVIKRLN